MPRFLFHMYVNIVLLWTKSTAQQHIELPDDLASLCPYTRFCNVTREPSQTLESFKPCCGSCSCETGCEKTQDCCTYEIGTNRRDEISVSSCVTAAVYGKHEPPGVEWYQMIDTCPNGQTCRFNIIDLTGGLFPHSSANGDFVYFNKACAECNSATELIPWSVRFVRNQASSVSHMTEITSSVENLLNGQIDRDDCVLHFLPPTEVETKTKECYPEENIVRDCLLDVTSNSVLERYQSLCSSFNATYQVFWNGKTHNFANVYCALCSGIAVNPNCSVESKTGKVPIGSLSLLLESPDVNSVELKPRRNEICKQVRSHNIQFVFRATFKTRF